MKWLADTIVLIAQRVALSSNMSRKAWWHDVGMLMDDLLHMAGV